MASLHVLLIARSYDPETNPGGVCNWRLVGSMTVAGIAWSVTPFSKVDFAGRSVNRAPKRGQNK